MTDHTKDNYLHIFDSRKWFMSLFANEMKKEGWVIYKADYNEKPKFRICYKFNNTHYDHMENKKVYGYAKEYGWIIDDKGFIVDYDINKLTRNRHLLTGSDLGLL